MKLFTFARKKARRRADRAREDESNALMPLFADLCAALDVQAIFELGAHAAEFSILMHGRMPSLVVVALEANPYVFERYRDRMPEGVRYLNMAAGADSLPKQFHVVKSLAADDGMHGQESTNPFSGLMTRDPGAAEYETVTTACTTVDALHAEYGRPRTALWIDVEGANELVLRGATQSLAGAVQCILIEVEEKSYWEGQWLAADVKSFLATAGFAAVARDLKSKPQYNIVFVRKNALAGQASQLVSRHLKTGRASRR